MNPATEFFSVWIWKCSRTKNILTAAITYLTLSKHTTNCSRFATSGSSLAAILFDVEHFQVVQMNNDWNVGAWNHWQSHGGMGQGFQCLVVALLIANGRPPGIPPAHATLPHCDIMLLLEGWGGGEVNEQDG